MYMEPSPKKQLAIYTAPYYKAGSEARYYRVSKCLGAKLYISKKEATKAARRQYRLWQKGLAPAANKKIFKIVNIHDCYHTLYGYITEHVPRIGLSDRNMSKLVSKLENEGFDCHDIREENVGLLRGRPVCIDFGDLSWVG